MAKSKSITVKISEVYKAMKVVLIERFSEIDEDQLGKVNNLHHTSSNQSEIEKRI